MKKSDFFVVLSLALASFSPTALAYLDPGTGSMIISAVVGIFATALLAIKTYWYKLVSFFKGKEKSRRGRNAADIEGK